MRCEIIIGSKKAPVTLKPIADSNGTKFCVSTSKQKYSIEILAQNDTRTIVSIDNRVYSLKVLRGTSSDLTFAVNERIVEASTKKKVAGSENGFSGITMAQEVMRSNFPAKIVKILSKEGDRVNQGDTIMVVEAMKMEAQIKAPGNCVVKEIFVKEGEMVERGKALARLGPA